MLKQTANPYIRIVQCKDTVLMTNLQNEPNVAKIKVRDWYSAFVLLAIGSSLAFFVFIYEVTHRCCKRVKEIHNRTGT